jgi:hypothetical protein
MPTNDPTLDHNAIALAKLLVRIGKDNTALNHWEKDFVDGVESILLDVHAQYSDRQMAVVRRLADKVMVPDSNLVWIDRFTRFTIDLQKHGVDGRVIRDSMMAAWPEWDDP